MRTGISIVLAGLFLASAGCEKKTESTGAAPGAGGVGGAMNAAKDAASDTFSKLRDQAVATLEPKLEDLKGQMTKLKDKVASVPEAMKPTVNSSMAEIEKQLDAAGDQLTKLKDAGADTWQTISTELGSAMDKLGTAIKDMAGKFPS